ncbi:hypothetical protein PRIPAC_84852 [Pristionchus pacificus]|uniref:Uncharacterized protein n=1 Tax=Pristionchus pacificus TaxID=54126 RepID=A0A2A6BUQ0_PRIPA|nr:hypothetical protein PRIPAC_84852 [Pristionchus pacificus]|eukprot:PDM69625.1 hypothetical protein PRIPAC_44721 [Pristionchus pacificus]
MLTPARGHIERRTLSRVRNECDEQPIRQRSQTAEEQGQDVMEIGEDGHRCYFPDKQLLVPKRKTCQGLIYAAGFYLLVPGITALSRVRNECDEQPIRQRSQTAEEQGQDVMEIGEDGHRCYFPDKQLLVPMRKTCQGLIYAAGFYLLVPGITALSRVRNECDEQPIRQRSQTAEEQGQDVMEIGEDGHRCYFPDKQLLVPKRKTCQGLIYAAGFYLLVPGITGAFITMGSRERKQEESAVAPVSLQGALNTAYEDFMARIDGLAYTDVPPYDYFIADPMLCKDGNYSESESFDSDDWEDSRSFSEDDNKKEMSDS